MEPCDETEYMEKKCKSKNHDNEENIEDKKTIHDSETHNDENKVGE